MVKAGGESGGTPGAGGEGMDVDKLSTEERPGTEKHRGSIKEVRKEGWASGEG